MLEAAAALYGVPSSDLTSLGAFESDVYAFETNGQAAVLKIIAPLHRSPSLVQAEVDWLLSLADAGVPVAAPLPSKSGRYVEELPGPAGSTVVVAFRRAPGALTRPTDWAPNRIEAWGALLGRMQEQSRGWSPPGPRRGTLLEQTYLTRAAEIVKDDGEVIEAAAKLLARVKPLLNGSGDAGLIHADLHHGNLLLHGENWTAIDFDDCAYGAYAFDFAMPLYYALWAQRELDANSVAAEFLPPFLRGFKRHAPLPADAAEAVAGSLDARQAELYLVLNLKLPAERWTDQLRETVNGLRTRVVSGTPMLSAEVLSDHLH